MQCSRLFREVEHRWRRYLINGLVAAKICLEVLIACEIGRARWDGGMFDAVDGTERRSAAISSGGAPPSLA